jgi:hypothetical protein
MAKKQITVADAVELLSSVIGDKFAALAKKDKRAVRRFLLKSAAKLLRGKYASIGEWRGDAETALKPKAIDWAGIAAFLEAIQPLIESMIAMCAQT